MDEKNNVFEENIAQESVTQESETAQEGVLQETAQETKEENKKKISLSPKKKDILRKIIIGILVVVLVASVGYVGDYFYKSYRNKRRNNDYKNQFYLTPTATDFEETGTPISFVDLYLQNQDLVGWVKIEGTKTDNPVVQGRHDSPGFYEYLYKAYDGSYSQYGTIFAHYKNKFSGTLSSNTVLYGHHMINGTMFGDLEKMRKVEFLQKHNLVEFTPRYESFTDTWKIFAVIISDSTDTPNLPKEGPYSYMLTDFPSDYNFMKFVKEAYQRSIIKTPAQDIVPGDEILTLSTCIYDFKGARLLIMARKLRPGESKEMDASQITYNSEVVYPPAYYARKGGTKRQVKEYTFEDYSKEFPRR